MVFVSSFHPRGGVFCCSWRDGAVLFFSEAGRGGCCFFPRRDGVAFFFFFDGTGRLFWRWNFFWRDGAKSLHRPAKGGLNRPASRPCKALKKTLRAILTEYTRTGLLGAVYAASMLNLLWRWKNTPQVVLLLYYCCTADLTVMDSSQRVWASTF